MIKKKPKTIHYRHATLPNCKSNLQELLTKALDNQDIEKAVDRQEKPNSEEDEYRLINKHVDVNGALFCQFIFVKSGETQPIVTEHNNAKSFEIAAMFANSEDKTNENAGKAKKEFINAMMYFGVLENHVVILPSNTLNARELESHLFWLLSSVVGTLPNNSTVILQNQPPKEIVEKISKEPVRNIQIGAPISFKGDASAELIDDVTKKSEMVEIEKNDLFYNILDAIIPDWLRDNKGLEDSLDDSNLQLKLLITYSRKTTKSGQQVLDSIATSLRHVDDQDIKIHLEGGGIIDGDELKLSKKINVHYTDSGLYDETILYKEMRDWIITKCQDEEIY